MKTSNLLLAMLLVFGLFGCIEDTVQLENLSGDVEVERQIAIPLLQASLVFENLAGDSFDDFELLSNGDTVKLYLVDDISYEDTVEFGELGVNMDFEYIRIHHSVTNMFPVGLDLRLYLHNTEEGENVDTIWFSGTPGELFLNPAPVDADDLVIEENIETTYGTIELDAETLGNLFNDASHIVIFAEVPQSSEMVKILDRYTLDLDLGLSAKGRYVTSIDSIVN